MGTSLAVHLEGSECTARCKGQARRQPHHMGTVSDGARGSQLAPWDSSVEFSSPKQGFLSVSYWSQHIENSLVCKGCSVNIC